jgi:thiol-disulfide isomerase/thioredoxin
MRRTSNFYLIPWGGRLSPALVVLVVLVSLLTAFASSGQPLEPQVPAGEIYLEALEGAPLTARELGRRDTVAIFWASWSPRCRNIGARVDALETRWGREVRVITINFQEDASTIRTFLPAARGGWPVYLDSEGTFARRHHVASLPALVIFRDGEAVYQGGLGDEVDRVIARQLAGE